MNLAQRIEQPEIMDSTALPLPVMKSTLRRLSFINRTFGGVGLVRRYFENERSAWPAGETISILDAGTGGAEIPCALIRWARSRGVKLRITGIDNVPEAIALARQNAHAFPEIEILEDDFFALARRPIQYDYVIATLFLHHMPVDRTVEAIGAFNQLSRRGFLISDLERSRIGYWAVKTLCTLIGNWVVRHDGPLSVRRAFTVQELAALARDAGARDAVAARAPWFRLRLAREGKRG